MLFRSLDVIAGARSLIEKQQPVVLFECDAFGSETYIDDCLGTLDYFQRCGYRHFLLYDNFGNLMGLHALNAPATFRELLIEQLESDDYFEILVMRDDRLFPFYESEREHFAEAMSARACG